MNEALCKCGCGEAVGKHSKMGFRPGHNSRSPEGVMRMRIIGKKYAVSGNAFGKLKGSSPRKGGEMMRVKAFLKRIGM
jgi:hypothetical protein